MQRPQPATYSLQALQPLIDKLSALEQQALQGVSMPVAAMSAVLADALRATGREVMERLLDQAARAQIAAPCQCGAEAGSKGFEHTFFIGRFGRVPVSRRRMDCDCGRSWFAFDEAWSIPAGDYSDDVREATERLACRLGFDEAVAELGQLWGVAPDGTTAHRWVGQDGARAAESVHADAEQHWRRYEEQEYAVAAGRCRPAQRNPGFGVVELDGVHALTWKPGLEPRRKPAKPPPREPSPTATPASDAASETSEAACRHQPPSALSTVPGSPMGPTARSPRVHGREVCVGLVYRGEDACQESPGRGVLLEKRYVATLNDREHFWTQLHAAAATQGVLNAQTVVRVSDGGAYFIDYSSELFRDQPLVGILDIQHANQHVWEAGHQVIADPKKTPAWVLPLTQLIADGRVDDVIATLPAQRQHRRGRKCRTAIDKLDGYLSRHKHLMDYPRYKAAGYPIASAAIESTNKRLVGRRCKQGGMLWSEPGLESMVALRVAFYNPGAWQNLWPHAAAPIHS
jgi:hypothetical protein